MRLRWRCVQAVGEMGARLERPESRWFERPRGSASVLLDCGASERRANEEPLAPRVERHARLCPPMRPDHLAQPAAWLEPNASRSLQVRRHPVGEGASEREHRSDKESIVIRTDEQAGYVALGTIGRWLRCGCSCRASRQPGR